MAEPTRYDVLRSKALSGKKVRFEVIEDDGEAYAVRQGSVAISKAINAHKDASDKCIETVIQTVYEAIPEVDADGKQIVDEVEEPVVENVLDAEGMPEVEPWLDASGNPLITVEGKRLMRGKKRTIVDSDGNPVMRPASVPRYKLGRQLFSKIDADVLRDSFDGDGGFVAKVLLAFRKVSDRDTARVLAKKT